MFVFGPEEAFVQRVWKMSDRQSGVDWPEPVVKFVLWPSRAVRSKPARHIVVDEERVAWNPSQKSAFWATGRFGPMLERCES